MGRLMYCRRCGTLTSWRLVELAGRPFYMCDCGELKPAPRGSRPQRVLVCVELTPGTVRRLRELVELGHYSSVEDFVRRAIEEAVRERLGHSAKPEQLRWSRVVVEGWEE